VSALTVNEKEGASIVSNAKRMVNTNLYLIVIALLNMAFKLVMKERGGSFSTSLFISL
jgi:hypothetical protein